jgi:cytochrome c553
MPNLAGQKEQYLVAAITAYRDGTRSGVSAAMMTPMAAGLSDEEIAALAAHFAAME